MKVLTAKNPWASLIISGSKDVENRTRRINYRGRILIRASKKPDKMSWVAGAREKEYLNGCIIGSVEITDCVQNSTSQWAEKDMRHWI
jgi:hypothetical protein